MDQLQATLRAAGAWLLRLLDHAVLWLQHLDAIGRTQLLHLGVPPTYAGPLMAVLWFILALILLRATWGLARLLLLLLLALVLLRLFGVLPGPGMRA